MLELKHPLILASISPRRKEILKMTGINFEIVESLYEEPNHDSHLGDPRQFAEEVALGKGKEVYERLAKNKLILSADTLGILEGEVLEKPKDREDARRMLKLMSGKKHVVLTSVAILAPEEEAMINSIETEVHFRQLSDAEINHYLDHEEYLDKAAAYAIQGKASVFVKKIVGDYFNIVGLPIFTVWEMLRKWEK